MWWAERCGCDRVREILLEFALENGVEIWDVDVPPAAPLGLDQHGTTNKICDVCLLLIMELDRFYQCGVCNGGDFDVCIHCYGLGARCLDDSHKLKLETYWL